MPRQLPRLIERARTGILKISFALAIGVAVWWLVWNSAGAPGPGAHWAQKILIPIAILAIAALVVLRHERHWAKPVRDLRDLLGRARAGEIPIDEFSRKIGR